MTKHTVVRSFSKDSFERSTESGLFAFLGSGFAQIFGWIDSIKWKKHSDTNLVALIKKERSHLRLTFVAEKRPCLSSIITSRDHKTWCDNFPDHAFPPLTSLQSQNLAQATQNSAIQPLTPSHGGIWKVRLEENGWKNRKNHSRRPMGI